MTRPDRQAGSAVVEAMVAVAIIAVMLAVTYQALGQSTVRSRAAESSRMAAMIARSRLALVGADIPLQPGEASGTEGDFAWRVHIVAAPEAASDVGQLMSVTASVRGRRGGPDRAVLRTLRLAPAQAPATTAQ
jgi:type II secretory pathway component PulJ